MSYKYSKKTTSLGEEELSPDGVLFVTHTIWRWHSLSRQVLEVFRVLSRLDALFSIDVLLLDLLHVVGKPRSGRVLDIKALALESLELLDFLRRGHWRLQLNVRVEPVRFQMVSHQELCAVHNLEVTTKTLDSIDGLLGGVRNFESDGRLERAERVTSLS